MYKSIPLTTSCDRPQNRILALYFADLIFWSLQDTTYYIRLSNKLFSFLTGLKDDQSYRAWHADHVVFRWITGRPFQEGSIVYFEEYLHGKLHKAKFICTKVVPNQLIEYRSPFPLSIIFPQNQFITQATDDGGCIFTATIKIRMGPLDGKLYRKQIEGVKKHMKEEGENLKQILEG